MKPKNALVVFLLLVLASLSSATAQNGKLVPRYESSERFNVLFRYFSNADFLKDLLDPINAAINLPVDVPVVMGQCDEANAFYSPEDQMLIVCYELVQEFYDLTQQDSPETALDRTREALGFVVYHELGHALIDLLELPIVGREEDVADQFAVMVLATWDTEHLHMILEGADMFERSARVAPADEMAFWDEHSLHEQRYANFLCWAYGSNPQEYRIYLELAILSERRKSRCVNEYNQLVHGWITLLNPYLKPEPSP
ncbi:DUF4344 domain-containing metallopeptidase [Deinococcus roseus]|uniref:Metallopeptidase n=1 Tax=Deinococcus roseus TaxID=392414 RepID=A0ABQ2DEW5_9DEIO|nr:DUF4344 domain-containing metallopeptidase [Deinococcus roseus]GGJ53440.1 hypothetical protein GCM10008938_44330 [Deinococcus roseus]